MSIWKTTPPTTQDYPIWAFTGDSEDVILIRTEDDHQPTRLPITWCKADIPMKPVNDEIDEQYQAIRRSTDTSWWLNRDWFRTGYEYGKRSNGTCGCDKGQAAKSPFVNPEDFFDDEACLNRVAYESAFDERL